MTFSFHNEFDDVTISFEDASPDCSGPFSVTTSFGPDSMNPGESKTESFTDLAASRARFLELVSSEFDAVIA